MSTINLKAIEWENMFSYGPRTRVELCESRVVQIVGVNGAGKSSIPIILEEATYNKNSKGFKKSDIPNRHINQAYEMLLQFDVDSDNYELEVKKGSALKATMTKNGEDISQHTGSKTIQMFEELVNLDFKTFTQLIYQSTESSLQFLTATDSKRKEFLISLFDMSEYGAMRSKFDESLKEVKREIATAEGKISATESSLKRVQSLLNLEIGELLPIPGEPDDLVQEKSQLEAQLSTIEEDAKRIRRDNSVIDSLKKLRSIEDIQSDIDSVESIDGDTSALTTELADHNAVTKEAQRLLDKVEGLDDKCPTCLQDVDKSFVESLQSEQNERIVEARSKAQVISEKLKAIKLSEAERTKFKSELDSVEAAIKRAEGLEYKDIEDPQDLRDSVSDLNSRISKARDSLTKTRAHNQKVEADMAKKQSAEEQCDDILEELEAHQESLEELEKKVGPLETLKKAFSATGLVAYKLENRVKDLESETNEYLSRLSDGRFNLTFELENDKLNVVIFNEDNPVSINTLSSGERARVVIGTLLGIRNIMQRISKTTINVLFLDEVISVMDDEGKEQLVDVLLEENNLNTFLVSHSWQHPLVPRLLVEKDDSGISRISNG